jgi:tetratricopeptide (TPR) repeat protein
VTSRWSETRFYQGLSFSKLDQKDKAEEIFDELIDSAKEKLSQDAAVDVFAKFGRQQTEAARKASAHYALGLGYLGKGLRDKAKVELEKAVKLNVSHVWAKNQLDELR